jgi:hypothetical protein
MALHFTRLINLPTNLFYALRFLKISHNILYGFPYYITEIKTTYLSTRRHMPEDRHDYLKFQFFYPTIIATVKLTPLIL